MTCGGGETLRLRAISAIAFLSAFSGVYSATKRWTPNYDYEDPVNWDIGRVPSSADTAAFPADTAVPIVVPSAGVNVCRMVLPANGQLILEPDAQIVISASRSNYGCPGDTVTFKQNVPLEWADPENWSSREVNLATPHVERIPCEHDTVVFDPSHSFSVVLPDLPITVGSIQFGNQTFDQEDLDEFLTSDVGDQRLRSASPDRDTTIWLTTPACSDPGGCECGTEGRQGLLETVCKTASGRCPEKLGCVTPVKPIGHCCRICGAFFVMNYKPIFSMEKFNKTFNKDMDVHKRNDENLQVFTHIGKLSKRRFQLVLVSGAKYVDEINERAKIVDTLLTSYAKSNMGLADVQMFSSGLSFDVDGMTYGQMALTTFLITTCGMTVIIVYYTNSWRTLRLFGSLVRLGSQSNDGTVFVKFQNETNDVELINEDVAIRPPPRRKSSFENPTYGAMQTAAASTSQQPTFAESLSYVELTTKNTMPPNDTIDLEMIMTKK